MNVSTWGLHKIKTSMIEISNRTNLTEKEIEEIIEKYYSDRDKKTKKFLRRAIKKYGDIYDYSEVNYINNATKVRIFCPRCNDFFSVIPANFTIKTGAGCPVCSRRDIINNLRNSGKNSFEEFIKKLGNYRVIGEYKNQSTRVSVEDIDTGEAYDVIPSVVRRTYSVKRSSSHGEDVVRKALQDLEIPFQEQKVFMVDEIPDMGKVREKQIVVDFFVVYNGVTYIIEYNGEQHYREVPRFSKKGNSSGTYISQVKRDTILNSYCAQKGYSYLEIPYIVKDLETIRAGLEDIIIKGNEQNCQKYFPHIPTAPCSPTNDRFEIIVLGKEDDE